MMKQRIAISIFLALAGCTPRLYVENARLTIDDRRQIEEAIRQSGQTNRVQVAEGEKRTKGRKVSYRVVVRNADDPELAEGLVYDLVKSNQTWVVREQTGQVIF